MTETTQAPSPPVAGGGHNLDLYLRRMRWALAPLPEEDRGEIVAETLSHLLDRLGGHATFDQAEELLGAPEIYARGFLESYEISTSLGSGSVPRMLGVATRLAGRGAKAFFAVVAFFVLYSLAFSLALVALLKPVFPDQVGLWMGEENFVLGYLPTPPTGTDELLGLWVVPLAVTASFGLFRFNSSLLRRFLASRKR